MTLDFSSLLFPEKNMIIIKICAFNKKQPLSQNNDGDDEPERWKTTWLWCERLCRCWARFIFSSSPFFFVRHQKLYDNQHPQEHSQGDLEILRARASCVHERKHCDEVYLTFERRCIKSIKLAFIMSNFCKTNNYLFIYST